MEEDKKIAQAYAEALYHVAVAEGVALAVLDEMRRVAQLLKENRKMQEFIAGSKVTQEGKRRALAEILGDKIYPASLNHLVGMVDQGRGRLIPDMICAYQDAVEAGLEQVTADVVSAVPLDDATLASMADALAKAADKRVHCINTVDTAILGGVLVRMGGEVIDGSVRRRLVNIRQALAVSS